VRQEELELPRDGAGYARRACPRCLAHFKVRVGRRDERVLAAAITRRADAIEAGLAPASPRHCPYCGECDEAERFWTDEQLRWVDAHARRLADEVRWRRLRAPLERLAANPRPTYVLVFPPARPLPPPRDDPDDMTAIPLPCCGEEQKVSGGWIGPVRCHYCGCVHARDVARDIGMEIALLRKWVTGRRPRRGARSG
jgi:hypothetical protein